MTIAIDDAVARVLARPASVLIPDTCNFLDLFRCDSKWPRVPTEEIEVCSDLRRGLGSRDDAAHFFVPELVPREFADNADKVQQDFHSWLENHDFNQEWIAMAQIFVPDRFDARLFAPAVLSLRLHESLRNLAERLLAEAPAFERDRSALDRAVARSIAKRRPSHSKEIKDSMNLEQVLLFCSRLRAKGGTAPVAFISSNTNDFAETRSSTQLHPELRTEFNEASLEYFTSFRAAVGSLRASGQMP